MKVFSFFDNYPNFDNNPKRKAAAL